MSIKILGGVIWNLKKCYEMIEKNNYEDDSQFILPRDSNYMYL